MIANRIMHSTGSTSANSTMAWPSSRASSVVGIVMRSVFGDSSVDTASDLIRWIVLPLVQGASAAVGGDRSRPRPCLKHSLLQARRDVAERGGDAARQRGERSDDDDGDD